MEFAGAIDAFLRYCAVERQLAENTLQAYACDLADFRKWLLASGAPAETTTETLKLFLDDLVASRKLAVASVRRRIACLRGFYRWRQERGLGDDPFTGWRLRLPRRKRLPRALTRPEVSSLLAALRAPRPQAHEAHASLRVAVRLMVATGLRVGELCKLRVDDVSPDGASLRVRGKGSRDRIAYVGDVAFRAELRRLVDARCAGEGAALFVNRHGGTMRPQSIRQKLGRAGEEAGLARRITPHMLCHTAPTLLIESGVDIRFVQRLLGHSTIATTEIYTHVTDEALRTSLERANVLGGLAAG